VGTLNLKDYLALWFFGADQPGSEELASEDPVLPANVPPQHIENCLWFACGQCHNKTARAAPPGFLAAADAPPAVQAPPPARAAAVPQPADAAASAGAGVGGAGGGGNLLAQLAAERHARRGVPAPAAEEVGPPALEEVKLLTCAPPFLGRDALLWCSAP
jgi:hypothetical protein